MEKLDPIGLQHRFWRAIAEHAPEVMEDLFDRYQGAEWNDDQWLARSERWIESGCQNPRENDPHPAAMAWCDHWGLPDWCLRLAETALWKLWKRQGSTYRRQAWDKAAGQSHYYYFRPPALEFNFNPWSGIRLFQPHFFLLLLRCPSSFVQSVLLALIAAQGTVYAPISRDEYLKQVIEAATKAAGAHYDECIAGFKWFSADEYREFREFDTHCRWAILYILGLKDREIAERENNNRSDAISEDMVKKARYRVAKALGIEFKDRKGGRSFKGTRTPRK
jgi:hypothetical protein